MMEVNLRENDVVVLLSDSEDETNRESDVHTDKSERLIYNLNSETTIEVLNPSADDKPGIFAKSITQQTQNVEAKSNDNEDSVILLDDSQKNSDAELPSNDKHSSKEQHSIAMQTIIDLCVDESYETEGNSTTLGTSPANQHEDVVETPNSQNNDKSTVRLDEMEVPPKISEKRECINYDCKSNKKTVEFRAAPMWALNHFNVPFKVNRNQCICQNCFDTSSKQYKRLCEALVNQQPLLLEELPARSEVVELLDSEDEEDNVKSRKKSANRTERLSSATMTFLEDNFEDVVKETFKRINIEQQMMWTNQILEHKIGKNEAMSYDLDVEIKSIENLADTMHKKLYKNPGYLIKELPPLDLNEKKQVHMYGPDYPPRGEVIYPPVDTNSLYYAVRVDLLSAWISCRVTEDQAQASVDGKEMFKVQFIRKKGFPCKMVPGNHLAYGKAPSVRLSVGTRVIAISSFAKYPSTNLRSTFFPGIIAEPLQAYNRYRYLVFFDDGYAQYVTPDNIRLICSPSPNLWDDVYHDSADFIKTYLEQYKTHRPMVQVKRGQRMITEWNSQWTHARVHDIDGSLVLMYFENANRYEWIYRGSTRLGPLFKDRQLQKHSGVSGKRPFVEYKTNDDGDDGKTSKTSRLSLPEPIVQQAQDPPAIERTVDIESSSPQVMPPTITGDEQRSVARKSVTVSTRPQPTVQHMNCATIYIGEDDQMKGQLVHFAPKNHQPPKKFVRHICDVGCMFQLKHDLSAYNPLVKPLLSGWERDNVRHRTRKVVVYRMPCGRIVRNMIELHKFLRFTKCPLNVDSFDYDVNVQVLTEFVVKRHFIKKRDLSDGCEPMVVSCVNYYDDTMPPACVYSDKRVPNEGVNLNLDPNFLCGCDCEDDCMDKTKCNCWKLTLEGEQFSNPDTPIDQVGYQFKRLLEPVPTGIYECNSQCKCSKTCLNRVAQHPLQLKLQVFKTVSRGWGLRCLNDVPKGGFICVYAGDLLTDQNANSAGNGDEYLAELDYIEVNESRKEGYESGVMDDDEFDPNTTRDDSDVETASEKETGFSVGSRIKKKNAKLSEMEEDPMSGSDSDESDAKRQLISFVPNSNSQYQYKSIHKFYDKNERLFIMDGKKRGNVGRYINHSCSPNLFVQNVFVDTHDLRFPWVAFFALFHIPAGSELTWDYNYVVGSVPGKILNCECGSKNCKGRIL